MLGGFTVQQKIGKEKPYLTENWLSGNEMWCLADNHNYMCHVCAEGFLDSNYNQATKYQFFTKLPQIFTYSKKF